jgi:hypothetical protein
MLDTLEINITKCIPRKVLRLKLFCTIWWTFFCIITSRLEKAIGKKYSRKYYVH